MKILWSHTLTLAGPQSPAWRIKMVYPTTAEIRGLPGLELWRRSQGSSSDGETRVSLEMFCPSDGSMSKSPSSSWAALESDSFPYRSAFSGSDGFTWRFLRSRCCRRSSGTVFFSDKKRDDWGRFCPTMNTCFAPSRLSSMPCLVE